MPLPQARFIPTVKIRPAANGLGFSYYLVRHNGREEEFAYVWATRVGSSMWWANLLFMADIKQDNPAWGKLLELLRKKKEKLAKGTLSL